MRTVNDLRSYEERFSIENFSPFVVPDEMELVPLEEEDLESVRLVLSMSQTGPERDCAEHNAAGTAGGENDGENTKGPADNIGPEKYRDPTRVRFPYHWGGYDGGAEASFDGGWDPMRFGMLKERLDVAKQASDDGKTAEQYISFGGLVWFVRPTGAAVGVFKYKYVLECRGVVLYVHSNPVKNIAPIRFRLGFECLARTDIFQAVQTLKEVLKREGFCVTNERISRVDMQVMLPIPISEFSRVMIEPGRIATRCRENADFRISLRTGRLETITLTSGNCELCFFNDPILDFSFPVRRWSFAPRLLRLS